MQELFLGLLERGERETILIGDKLARNAQSRSGLPFFQGPDLGSAQAGLIFSSPKNLGIFVYNLGSSACQYIKPKMWKGIIQLLHWRGGC